MLRDPLSDAVQRDPSATALEAEGRVWSYGELDERVRAFATQLGEAGAQRGDRIAMLLPVGPESVVAAHAAWRSGAVLVPMHDAWPGPEIARCLAALPTNIIVAIPGDDRIAGTASLLPAVDRPARALPTVGPRSVSPDDPCTIIWTSGTTGRPRGVELTWGNMWASATAIASRLGLRPTDRWYAALPVAHIGGLALVFRAASVGASVMVEGFDAGSLARSIDAGRISHASLVPTMLQRLLDARADRPVPDSLRLLLVGGAETPRPLLERAIAGGYPIATTYGLTECTSQVATATPDLVRRKPGTVGPPLDGVEIRIGDDGAIAVSGPTLMRRYVGGTAIPRDGWFATADLGRVDADGDLWITGRRDARIITGGVTVDPAEIEQALLRYPGLRDACVVGVEDPEWGESVAAAVVFQPGITLDTDDVAAHCRTTLAAAKCPRRWVVTDVIPRNANGKVERNTVAAWFSGPRNVA
ncbi:MAG TPA: class I adenylate-forming enzyme family protein [Gemmatimonadales bacterium]